MEGIFYKKVSEYNNELNPLKHYAEQISMQIMTETGVDEDRAMRIAKNIIKERLRDPKVEFFFRKDNGDRELKVTSLLNYIEWSKREGNIIVPTFTTYLPSKRKPSMLASYTKDNVEKRAITKKQSQQARAEGNYVVASALNRSQNNKKIKNNALSGLMCMSGSVIYNPSGHSALTSLTRSITSLTNAQNERLVTGNRCLITPRTVFRSVVNEATYCDQEKIKIAIEKYNLYIPTTDDIIEILKRSSDLYAKDNNYYRKYIIPFVDKLTPYQKAGIAYTMDLHHLIKHNSDFVRGFLTNLTHKETQYTEKMDNPNIIEEMDTTIVYFVHAIFFKELFGFGKKYEKMNEAGFANNLYHTCLNVMKVLEEYKDFINAFFMVDFAPINSHRLAYMRRRAVVLSDTDSSAVTTDDIIRWFCGDFIVNEESISVSSAVIYMVSESIIHQLTRLSKTMNFEEEHLRTLAMKNEYFWDTHVPSFASKHYFAGTKIVEGNILPETDLEVKGVHLKSSTVPDKVIEHGDELMKRILSSVSDNTPLNLDDILRDSIDFENMIINAVKDGDTTYLRNQRVNEEDAYDLPGDESNYRHHLFYIDVFEPKYGNIPEPPYVTSTIPVNLSTKTLMTQWLDGLEDQDFKARFIRWMDKSGRKTLENIYLEKEFLESNGLPQELKDCLDVDRVAINMTTQLRTILETMGLVLTPGVLIRDQFVNLDK